jgi:hypothetical protein
MSCGEIISSYSQCNIVPGALARVVMFDFFNLDYYTEENGVITDIKLLPGKFSYEFLGYPHTFTYSEEFEGQGFRHKHSFFIPERTQPQKKNIQAVCNSRVVSILFNRDGTAELAGRDVGLEVLDGQIRAQQLNDGFYMLNLQSPLGEYEDNPMPLVTANIDDLLDQKRYILLETGWYILLETGQRILLEG